MTKISSILVLILLFSAFLFGQGSSIGTAVSVAPNGSASGTVSNTSTDHFWKITTPSNGYLRIQTNSDSGIDVDVTLFDVNGTSSILFDGRSGTYSEVYSFVKPGTYYVQVHRWQGTTGSYTMTTTFLSPPRPAESETNDTWSTALSLSPNGIATGNIGYFGNGATDADDFYKITVSEDGWLRVQVQSDSLDSRGDDYLDIDATFFDVNGTSSRMFDGRSGSFSQVSEFVRPGTYFVNLHRWHGRGGSYQIKADFFVPPGANDGEGNDSPSTATQTTVDNTTWGHLGYFSNGTTDVDDWWKFTVPSDGKIFVQVTGDSLDRSGTVLDLDLTLYDANGTSSLAYDGGSGKISQCTIYARPGTFYAKVHRWLGNAGSYSLRVAHTPPLRANDPEGNDWFTSASSLTYNVAANGHLGYMANGSTDNNDYWKLVAPATDSIYVHVSSDSTLELDLSAYGTDTTSALSYDGRYGTYSRVGFKATAGVTYYFKVFRYSGTAGGYSITASRSSVAVGIEKAAELTTIPRELMLEQNYPNPFNPSTTIRYGLAEESRVRLSVYSLLGQEIAVLVNSIQPPSLYSVVWNGRDHQGSDVPSGMYVIRLQAGDRQMVKKAMLIR